MAEIDAVERIGTIEWLRVINTDGINLEGLVRVPSPERLGI